MGEKLTSSPPPFNLTYKIQKLATAAVAVAKTNSNPHPRTGFVAGASISVMTKFWWYLRTLLLSLWQSHVASYASCPPKMKMSSVSSFPTATKRKVSSGISVATTHLS